MRRRLPALVAVTGALLATAALAQASQTAAEPPPGTTFGGVHMVTFQQQGNQPTTAAQYALIARSNDIVVAQPRWMAQIGAPIKADNPNIMLLIYENGMFSTNTDPSGMPESWYLHDSKGNRVQSRNKGNWLMNPLSTSSFSSGGVTYKGWSDYVAKECVRDQQSLTVGCYLDMLGPGPLRSSYNAGGVVPIDPRTGKAFDPVAYEAMTGSVADVVRPALPGGSVLIGNGYSTGMAYFTKGTSQLNDHTDSAQAQTWMGGDDLTQSFRQWQRSVDMIIDNGNCGSSIVAHYGSTTTANEAAQRTFALASYLLGNTGHAYFDFAPSSGAHTWEDWSSLYDLQLGTPTQNATSVAGYLKNNVYQRTYTNGRVLVNPNGSNYSVSLGATYHTLDGQAVTSVSVPAHSAVILTS